MIILMRGIPGSGKSSYARANFLDPDPTFVLISADLTHVGSDGVWRFDAKKLPAAHDGCLHHYDRIIPSSQDGPGVVVDNTNISGWEVGPYYRLAEIYKIDVKIITCVCDPLKAFKRNIHSVPLKTILDMHKRLISEELPHWWKQEYVLTEE